MIKFGFCVPIFANPGMAFFRTPSYEKLDWKSLQDTVIHCEEQGYDSVFVADHLFLGNQGEIWECLTAMSAFAAVTKKISVIPIHLCNNFRTPSITAKSLATLSHISNGRVEIFYDYGWRKEEFDAYGIEFGSNDDDRIEQMSEGLEVIKGMLSYESFSYEGKYYTVKDAVCNPLPAKKIPIWMGEANNSNMVTHIVKHADVFNSMPCSVEGFSEKLKVIEIECQKQGRDIKDLELSLETQILIRETDEEIDNEFESYIQLRECNDSFDDDILEQLQKTNPELEGYNSKEDFLDEFMIGTPDVITRKIQSFIDKGVSHFMFWFMDYPSHKGIDLFAKKVMPIFKEQS